MPGNYKMIRELNKSAVMNIIRVHKSVSKTQIAKETGLSANAVGMITARLIEKGYVFVKSRGESSGGRKPELLSLTPGIHHAIGIDIDVDRIRFAVVDIAGNIVQKSRVKINCVGDLKPVFAAIGKALEQLTPQNLLGIGLAVAGQVDVSQKVILSAPNLKWNQVDLKQLLPSNVPIFVENEAMASAIYEHLNGCCQKNKNFICVNSKSGIGAGIFINGQIYRGSTGCAGEIGHMVVEPDGLPCPCGSRGCLEIYASSRGIINAAGTQDIQQAVSLAQDGNETVHSIFRQAARYLGIVLAGLVNALNPEKIVLGKEFAKYDTLILEEVRSVIVQKALPTACQNLEIIISPEDENSSVLGAAYLPLDQLVF